MRTAAYAFAAMIAAGPVTALDKERQCLAGSIGISKAFLSLWHINTQEWQCGQNEFKNGKAPPQITLKGNAERGEGWIDVPGVPSLKTRFSLEGLNARWRWTTGTRFAIDHFFTIYPNGTAEFGQLLTGEKPRVFAHCIAVHTDHQHTSKCLERAYRHCKAVDLPPEVVGETSFQDPGQYYDELNAEFWRCMETRDAE